MQCALLHLHLNTDKTYCFNMDCQQSANTRPSRFVPYFLSRLFTWSTQEGLHPFSLKEGGHALFYWTSGQYAYNILWLSLTMIFIRSFFLILFLSCFSHPLYNLFLSLSLPLMYARLGVCVPWTMKWSFILIKFEIVLWVTHFSEHKSFILICLANFIVIRFIWKL